MFTVTAQRRGAHWQLHDAEKTALGDSIANVLKHVPIPERELGIAADLFALAVTSYVIVAPRIEHDRAIAAGNTPAPAPSPTRPAPGEPTPPAPGYTVGETDPDLVSRLAHEALGVDLTDPANVTALNDLARRTTEPLVAEGDAVLGGRIEVQGDEHDKRFRNGNAGA